MKWTRTFGTNTGERWTFRYQGGSYIYIAVTGMRDSMFMIGLIEHGMRPDDVTAPWLHARAFEWIKDREAAA